MKLNNIQVTGRRMQFTVEGLQNKQTSQNFTLERSKESSRLQTHEVILATTPDHASAGRVPIRLPSNPKSRQTESATNQTNKDIANLNSELKKTEEVVKKDNYATYQTSEHSRYKMEHNYSSISPQRIEPARIVSPLRQSEIRGSRSSGTSIIEVLKSYERSVADQRPTLQGTRVDSLKVLSQEESTQELRSSNLVVAIRKNKLKSRVQYQPQVRTNIEIVNPRPPSQAKAKNRTQTQLKLLYQTMFKPQVTKTNP